MQEAISGERLAELGHEVSGLVKTGSLSRFV